MKNERHVEVVKLYEREESNGCGTVLEDAQWDMHAWKRFEERNSMSVRWLGRGWVTGGKGPRKPMSISDDQTIRRIQFVSLARSNRQTGEQGRDRKE